MPGIKIYAERLPTDYPPGGQGGMHAWSGGWRAYGETTAIYPIYTHPEWSPEKARRIVREAILRYWRRHRQERET